MKVQIVFTSYFEAFSFQSQVNFIEFTPIQSVLCVMCLFVCKFIRVRFLFSIRLLFLLQPYFVPHHFELEETANFTSNKSLYSSLGREQKKRRGQDGIALKMDIFISEKPDLELRTSLLLMQNSRYIVEGQRAVKEITHPK